MYVDWGPPHFGLVVCIYISHTDTSSILNLILQRLQQKLQKSCSRCNKNTWHVESGYILQPPKYLLLFVNRFRYLRDNVTKDASYPWIRPLGFVPLQFSLRATIEHHGPSIHSSHYTATINCRKKHYIATITQLRSLELLIAKKSSTAYVILYVLIDICVLDSNRRMGVWSLPWRWHILSIPLTTGRGTGAETCGLDDRYPPDDLWLLC